MRISANFDHKHSEKPKTLAYAVIKSKNAIAFDFTLTVQTAILYVYKNMPKFDLKFARFKPTYFEAAAELFVQ
jgi:hypothetical protein